MSRLEAASRSFLVVETADILLAGSLTVLLVGGAALVAEAVAVLEVGAVAAALRGGGMTV